jgi:hypothetical protein
MQAKFFAAAHWAILAVVMAPFATASTYNFTSFDGPGQNGGGTTVDGISNSGSIVGFSTNNAATPTLFTNFVLNPNGCRPSTRPPPAKLRSASTINP